MKRFFIFNFAGRFAAAGLLTLAFGSCFAQAQPAIASGLVPPAVPDKLHVEPGNVLFLEAHAQGTQNYICLPSASGFAWTFFSPQATLFTSFKFFNSEIRQQIITHFLSPNPVEGGTGRATWQSSLDTSAVWAKVQQSSDDAKFVATGAIPWLLLEQVGTQRGPTGGDLLAHTTFVQRVNTSGGVAPSDGCSTAANVGATALVPYTADYFFYKKSN